MLFNCYDCKRVKDGRIYTWPDDETDFPRLICEACYHRRRFINVPVAKPDPYRQLYPLSEVMGKVEERLDMGARQYGDSDYWGKDVLTEIEAELLDIMAYAYLEYLKLQRIKGMMKTGGVE